jgi:adenylosuccinate synthase
VRLCNGYRRGGATIDILPYGGADQIAHCEPIYEDFPGWSQSTQGVRDWDALPANARNYLRRLEEVAGAPIDLISTGPDREQTIVRREPFND